MAVFGVILMVAGKVSNHATLEPKEEPPS